MAKPQSDREMSYALSSTAMAPWLGTAPPHHSALSPTGPAMRFARLRTQSDEGPLVPKWRISNREQDRDLPSMRPYGPQPAPPSRRPSYYAASSVHASFNDFLRDAPRPHVSFWHLVTAYTLPLFANNNIYPKALITELQQNKLISFAVFYIKRTRFVQLRRFHMSLAPCTWIHIKLCK